MMLKRLKPRPLPIWYIEDDVRRQFFRDHPFEAFRPRTLVEGAGIQSSHAVNGQSWTRLRQRGRNPSPEEYAIFNALPSNYVLTSSLLFNSSAIQFALNLHQHHNFSLSEAYERAISQFRALRSEHHIATTFATREAEIFGAVFDSTEIENAFEKEKKALQAWKQKEELDEGAIAAKKRWKAIIERNNGESEWTKGEEYVRLWKENIKPEYAPELTQPINATQASEAPREPTSIPSQAEAHVTTHRQ
jgi:small subunit ribosomal protein S23